MVDVNVSLAKISSQYQTRNTLFVCSAVGWELMLPADPHRWWLMFQRASNIAFSNGIQPGPIDPDFIPNAPGDPPPPMAFRDCPSVVTGEWYAWGPSGETYLITECLYMGG